MKAEVYLSLSPTDFLSFGYMSSGIPGTQVRLIFSVWDLYSVVHNGYTVPPAVSQKDFLSSISSPTLITTHLFLFSS